MLAGCAYIRQVAFRKGRIELRASPALFISSFFSFVRSNPGHVVEL